MRNQLLNRMNTLLAALRMRLYTGRAKTQTCKFRQSPARSTLQDEALDALLFDNAASITSENRLKAGQAYASSLCDLAAQLEKLDAALTYLREPSAFPTDCLTQTPCAMEHVSALDDFGPILFETAAPTDTPHQDTTIGGETDLLFGEAPTYFEPSAYQAA
ncbi:MAG: hypothetical protein AAGF20_07300 [Pseudomonadota bacterium]